jgi:anti-anti-sigma factor
MFNVKEDADTINFTISSEMPQVDRVIEESHIFFHQLNIGASELSNLNLVLREMLNNAIEHGNHGIPDKEVRCDVQHLGRKRFKIQVEDQGEGFDHNSVDWEIPVDPRQTRNRGYALINTFCDQVKFNDKGNLVTAYISLVKETEFQVKNDGQRRIIIPSGNLTAAVEKKFRSLLESLLEEGVTKFRFDFSVVEDIDSVSLSVLIVFSKMVSKKEDWNLQLTNLNGDIRNLFKMTRVDRIYDVLDENGTQ